MSRHVARGGTHRLLGTHLRAAHLARMGRRAAHTTLGRAALRAGGHLRSAMRGGLVDGTTRRGNATLARWRVGMRWAHSRLHARRRLRVVGRTRRGIVRSAWEGGRIGRGPGWNKYGGLLLLLEIGWSGLRAGRDATATTSCRRRSAGAVCEPNEGRSGTLAAAGRHGRSRLGRVWRGRLDGGSVAFGGGATSLLRGRGLGAGWSGGSGQLLCARDGWRGLRHRAACGGRRGLGHVALGLLLGRCAILTVLGWSGAASRASGRRSGRFAALLSAVAAPWRVLTRLLLLFVQALASSAATSTAATSFAASAHKLRCIWSWCCAG